MVYELPHRLTPPEIIQAIWAGQASPLGGPSDSPVQYPLQQLHSHKLITLDNTTKVNFPILNDLGHTRPLGL